MKIIFFATSEFAIPALRELIKSGYEIAVVITQPDKPAGRKQEPLPSPVKVWALEHGLKVLQPPHLTSPTKGGGTSPFTSLPWWEGLREGVDIAVVASYGQIIPKEILDLPKYGTLNIHPSLLPKYRGPSPIHAAILKGDTETGVTIIKLDEEMDHGDIIASTKFEIRNSKPYYKDLHDKLAQAGAELLIKTLPDYISGKIKPVPQDHDNASFTKMITKDDARIDWSKSASEIEAQIRAFHLWPVAWTTLDKKRLKIHKAHSSPSPNLPHEGGGNNFPPLVGEIEGGDQKILIHCGQGFLEIEELQLEGRLKLSAEEFLNGFKSPTSLLSLK